MHESSWLQKWPTNKRVFQRQIDTNSTQSNPVRWLKFQQSLSTAVKQTSLAAGQYSNERKLKVWGSIIGDRTSGLFVWRWWFDRVLKLVPFQVVEERY